MKRTVVVASVVASLLAFAPGARAQAQQNPPSRSAQETSRGFGLGVLSFFGIGVLSGGALAAEYDTGRFIAGGMLDFFTQDNGPTVLGLGGRFYAIVHRTRSADFSVGGGLGVGFEDPRVGDADLSFQIEAGGRIRYFLTTNLATSLTFGAGVNVIDNATSFALGGRLQGEAGVIYFFE